MNTKILIAMKTKRVSTVETAKQLKQILKSYWPDVKFSVRSNKYSGGSSVDVRWTDGPRPDQVKNISDYFEGADFDGMRDLKTYKSKIELDNESGAPVKIKFGPDFIFPSRSYSEELTRTIATQIVNDFRLDESLIDRIKLHNNGTAWWDVMDVKPEGWTMYLDQKFHQWRCQIEATAEGKIKKHRISSTYLKKLAAKAYTQDDEYIFTEHMTDNFNLSYTQAWELYQQYLKSVIQSN